MKHPKLIFLLLLCALGMMACKQQKYNLNEVSDQRIVFGQGGGFTNAITMYTLMENGQLFKEVSMPDTVITLPRVKRKDCKIIFDQINSMDPSLFGAKQPGNRYYFLQWSTPEATLRSTWGANDYQPDPKIKGMYQLLMQQVNARD